MSQETDTPNQTFKNSINIDWKPLVYPDGAIFTNMASELFNIMKDETKQLQIALSDLFRSWCIFRFTIPNASRRDAQVWVDFMQRGTKIATYDRIENYWKRQRSISHRQYHTALKIMHSGICDESILKEFHYISL